MDNEELIVREILIKKTKIVIYENGMHKLVVTDISDQAWIIDMFSLCQEGGSVIEIKKL